MSPTTAPWLVLVLALSACTQTTSPPSEPLPFGHVHGLGLNPADDRLYVAAHTGVYKIVDGEPQLIANRPQDTMGFDIIGPDAFIGSGHPADPDDPNPLGFVTSDDAARTWEPVGLVGESDLHAIDIAGDGSVVALDTGRAALIRSSDDGKTWQPLLEGVSAIDLAAMPGPDVEVLISTTDGRTVRVRETGGASTLASSPPLTYIDVTPEGDVIGLGTDGRVWKGRGNRWTGLGEVDGQPSAISVAAPTWYVATSFGVYSSDDQGTTWDTVLP